MALQQPQEQRHEGFHFEPLNKRGWLFGIRGVQFLLVVAGILAGLACLYIFRTAWGAVVGVVVAFSVMVLTFIPMSGRNLDEWVRVVASYVKQRLTGRSRWQSAYPLLGYAENGAELQPPPTLDGLRILSARLPADLGSGEIGVAHDSKAGTYTALLVTGGQGFLLADEEERLEKVEALAGVQRQVARAGTPISALQFLERAVPNRGDAPVEHLARAIAESGRPASEPLVASYLSLIQDAGQLREDHEVLVSVQISTARAGRAIKRAGRGDAGACRVVAEQAVSVARALQDIGLRAGIADVRRLSANLRIAFEPEARNWMLKRQAAAPEAAGAAPASAFPIRTEASWGWYRTDSTYHATYWVREMPRRPVSASWMYPLLFETGSGRSLSFVLVPQEAAGALREAVAAQVSDDATAREKAHRGFRWTRSDEQQTTAAARREGELISGYGAYRYSFFATVSAPDLDTLEQRCERFEDAAAGSVLEVQRLVGQQDHAFTWGALPLGRGVRT